MLMERKILFSRSFFLEVYTKKTDSGLLKTFSGEYLSVCLIFLQLQPGHGMEWKFRCGIRKIPEWNGRFQEWNGRQSSKSIPH